MMALCSNNRHLAPLQCELRHSARKLRMQAADAVVLNREISTMKRRGIDEIQHHLIDQRPHRLHLIERKCRVSPAIGRLVMHDAERGIVPVGDETNLRLAPAQRGPAVERENWPEPAASWSAYPRPRVPHGLELLDSQAIDEAVLGINDHGETVKAHRQLDVIDVLDFALIALGGFDWARCALDVNPPYA